MTTIRGMGSREKERLKQDLTKQRRVAVANRIETVGEMLILAHCGCGADVMVTFSSSAIEKNKTVCIDCARLLVKEVQEAGRNVEVIRKPRAAKHVWRSTDGQVHPVTITKQKEPSMALDLNTVSDAELGAMMRAAINNKTDAEFGADVRERLLAQREAVIQEAVPVVTKERKVEEARLDAEHKAGRREEVNQERSEKVQAIMVNFDVSEKKAKKLLKEYESAN